MRRSRRVTLAVCLGSIPCLLAAYPAAMWLQPYCDLTPSEVRSVLVAFVLAALALPAIASLPICARRSLTTGSCHHCGYHLTGNTSGVCPECGTPTQRQDASLDRPVIIRTIVCTLCSAKVHVPVEAREWARCPNCGALVPV